MIAIPIILAVVVAGFILFALICSFVVFRDKKSEVIPMAFGKLKNSDTSISDVVPNLKLTNIE